MRKPGIFPTEGLMVSLSNICSTEDFKDDSCTAPLSKLLLGGSMNTCKTRFLTCVLGDHVVQGLNEAISISDVWLFTETSFFYLLTWCNLLLFTAGGGVSFIPKAQTRMILSEKPSNGTVAIAYGDMEEGDVLEAEDHLPTLPNTVSFSQELTSLTAQALNRKLLWRFRCSFLLRWPRI